jgi:3-oxoadipate enol-lactonase
MKTVRVRDLEMAVVDEGSGLPLLLVHGFPLDHSMWRYQIGYFAEHCRVIAPDLRGFGRTTVAADATTMEQMADDLAVLLAELGVREPILFCGLSMGGYVGWQFARKYPDRLRALIACDTRVIPDSPEQAANRRQMAERVLSEGASVVADAMLPKLFSDETRKQRPELVETTRQVILNNPPEGIAGALSGMSERPDMTEFVRHLELLTLIIVGEHDAISSAAEMQEIAESMPNASWVMVPNAGHMSPLENPEVFNEALREFITL